MADGWPVVTEPSTQWVIEDHFTLGRPALEQVGAQLVDVLITDNGFTDEQRQHVAELNIKVIIAEAASPTSE